MAPQGDNNEKSWEIAGYVAGGCLLVGMGVGLLAMAVVRWKA